MLYNDKCIVMNGKNYCAFSISRDLMNGDYGGHWRDEQEEEAKGVEKYVGLSKVSDKELQNP